MAVRHRRKKRDDKGPRPTSTLPPSPRWVWLTGFPSTSNWGGPPVPVLMSGAYHHAMVLSGYDRTRLYLLDSAGFQWIALRGAGLAQARVTKRHQVNGEYMFALSATPRA